MTIKVEFQNYKNIKDLKAELESGNVYFVKGGNNIGKTSFLKGLIATIKGKNPNKSATTFGAQEGSIKTQILDFKGADGQNYTIKFDFADGKDDKFTIIRPDTTVSKKSGDIASIFKYNEFTVDEFFAWGLTAEGRRKQAAVIMNLLPVETQEKIKEIDSKVNERNGTLFEARRNANAIWENKKVELANIELTAHEKQMQDYIKDNPQWLEETKDMQDNLDNASEIILANTTDLMEQQRLANNITKAEEEHDRIVTAHNTRKLAVEGEIKELQARIDKLKADFVIDGQSLQKTIDENSLAYDADQKAYDALTLKLESKKLPDVNKLKADLDERKDYMVLLEAGNNKLERKTEKLTEVQEAMQKAENLGNTIADLRKEKIDLIAKANLPVSNIIIEGDEIFYLNAEGNHIPFVEENLSYATGGLTVAQIMLAVNKDLPLLLIGKAAEYDNNSMAEIVKLAEENNAIVILDRVIPEAGELTIECYEGSAAIPATSQPKPDPIPTTETVNVNPTKPFDIGKI